MAYVHANREMSPLKPGDMVMAIHRFEGSPAIVVGEVESDRWGDPQYEIEWPDGKREVIARRALATEFSFGPSAEE